MKQDAIINDILSEDFEIPDCNCDLQELIERNINLYNDKPLNRKETTAFRRKLNELIGELNERRNFKAYNYVR